MKVSTVGKQVPGAQARTDHSIMSVCTKELELSPTGAKETFCHWKVSNVGVQDQHHHTPQTQRAPPTLYSLWTGAP